MILFAALSTYTKYDPIDEQILDDTQMYIHTDALSSSYFNHDNHYMKLMSFFIMMCFNRLHEIITDELNQMHAHFLKTTQYIMGLNLCILNHSQIIKALTISPI